MMMQILTWEKVLVTQVDVDAGVKARDHAVECSLFQAHACSTQSPKTPHHHTPWTQKGTENRCVAVSTSE